MNLNGCAMANQRLQFGATNSSDVKLRIIGTNGEEYEGNPLHLHSEALQEKSDFFKTWLSERWSSNIRPFEIEVTTSHPFENYIKCIERMYSSSDRFSNVDECLAILSVASELLADNLMQQCMGYLEAVRWNSEEESKIRNLLSSLNLSILPSLNARLNKQNNAYLDFVGENIKAMIYFLTTDDCADHRQPKIRATVGKFIVDNLQGDASSGIADLCRHIILEEFKGNIEIAVSLALKPANEEHVSLASNPANEEHAYFVLLWPFNLIERCDGTTMKAALRILCEKAKLAEMMMREDYFDEFYEYYDFNAPIRHKKVMLPILLGCLEALSNGKIIVEGKLRVGFLTTWLPVMGRLINSGKPGFAGDGDHPDIMEDDVLKSRLCRGVSNMIETLPFTDWKGIYKMWIDCCQRNYIDLSIPFGWGCKLLQEPQD